MVMVHHANRDGAMRGISRRADAMDLVMALRRPRDWRPADGARFELHLEKARLLAGAGLAPIEAQLCTGADGLAALAAGIGATAPRCAGRRRCCSRA